MLLTFTAQFPNLITAGLLLFSKSQFTRNSQNVLYLNQCTNRHIWSRIDANLKRPRDGCECFNRHKKNTLFEVYLHFKLELNAVGFLGAPTNKNLICWIQHVFGLYLENWSFAALYWYELFHCFDEGKSLLKFVSVFWYTLYKQAELSQHEVSCLAPRLKSPYSHVMNMTASSNDLLPYMYRQVFG